MESWLSESTKKLVKFVDYNDYHTLRQERRGGGISLYVQKKFRCRVLSELSIVKPEIESLFVELKTSNENILIAVVYRPPNTDANQFINLVSHLLISVKLRNYRETIFCGDFKLDFLTLSDNLNVQYF